MFEDLHGDLGQAARLCERVCPQHRQRRLDRDPELDRDDP